MSHYNEQREKFENQPKPYFVKSETGSPYKCQFPNKRDDEINELYDDLHPIIVD
jgi:hypothetical protein